MSEQTKKLVLQTLNEIKGEMAKRDETRYLMAMIMAISALESQSDWIPCAERLPIPHHKGQQREMFLVSLETGCVSTMFYEFNPNGYLGEGWSDKVLTVLAWQPLPEPWNGGNQ